jgi:uncharacterized protein with von Willebrand factor type A (vWA) domain
VRIAYLQFDENEARRRLNGRELMKLWNQLLLMASGDVQQALDWLKQLAQKYGMGGEEWFEEFVAGLRNEGYIEPGEQGLFVPTKKAERAIRKDSLDQVFRNVEALGQGEHRTPKSGSSLEPQPETRPFNFGDLSSDIDFNISITNALKRGGIDEFTLEEEDLEVHETEQFASCATVLMIDISHSMVLYGEDRITPAKRVAIALAELIQTKYPKDDLQLITFGDEAQRLSLSRLPYLQVGPFHTNTRAGLVLAQRLLARKKQTNKQIFMITDGKPSAIFENGRLYKNPFGLDPHIVAETLREADNCRRRNITISTFMIAKDQVLVDFIDRLTQTNKGRAYYSALDSLGGSILIDYLRNRRRRVR